MLAAAGLRLEGESRRAELIALAAGVGEKAAKEAEGLAAMVAAVAAGGDSAVRMAFIERLADVRFRLSTPDEASASPVVPTAVAKTKDI